MTEEKKNEPNDAGTPGNENSNGDANATPNASADGTAAVSQEALDAANKSGADAVAALLQTTRDANPGIPPDLIAGDNAVDIANSVAAGQRSVAAILELNKTPAQPAAAAAGAPPRPAGPAGPPDGARGLSKIAWALNNPGPGNTEPPAAS